jgi:hypothetical protein
LPQLRRSDYKGDVDWGSLVPGKRFASVAVGVALSMVAVASAPATPVVRPIAGASIAAMDCSAATATQLVNDNKLNNFLLPKPVVQVLCGPFTGPGSQAMAATIGAATCWSPQSWAVFNLTAAGWQLVFTQGAFLLGPLVAVGGDIRETTPVFRSTDPRCLPSGGAHARTWHWDGARFVDGPWKQVKKPTTSRKPKKATHGTSRTSASFYSPSRNISCEMDDERVGVGSHVYCQSIAHPHSVKMSLAGRLTICRDGTLATTHCLGDAGEHTPVLGYGKHITLAHFRCESQKAGVSCTVIKTGKGFRIDSAGVRRLGP